MKRLTPGMLRALRLTHRYVSYLCSGVLLVYLFSGLLLNHRKDLAFLNRKHERTVDYIFQLPERAEDFTAAEARRIMHSLGCNPDSYTRHTLSDEEITLFGREGLTVRLNATTQQATVREYRRPPFPTALIALHRNPGPVWTVASDLFLGLMFVLLATGLLLIPGRKGLWGIGGVLLLAGVAVPLLLYWIIAS